MSSKDELQSIIEGAFEERAQLTPRSLTAELGDALDETLALLDSGAARVAEPCASGWIVNQWLKKAVLLYFRTHDNTVMDAG
ncbi:MAG: 2,3,4,5-tetrahydropyridine-2,6-dicarboxylate N-succinyltransferase, partial [Sinobacteraceae bacterium]|nr:2,3,4,5-tetrahydropyridine-2,6-dicarboxylate N-succinyltransferase [Nevskiaceae bacterium]